MRLLTLIIIIFVIGSKFTHAEFQYSSVSYKLSSGTKYMNVTAVFSDVKTDAISEPIPTFTMGFDGNMDKGYFTTIRFDEKSFPIPDEVSSDQDQLGRFFVYPQTIEDGSFRKFYNYLDPVYQSLIEGVCEHFLDDNEIKKITSLKSVRQRVTDFLNIDHQINYLKSLALGCLKPTKTVYARDMQSQLSKLGYSLGKIDGKWGPKSQKALNQYFAERQINTDTKITTILLRKMQAELGELKQSNTLAGTGSNSQELATLDIETKFLKNFKSSIENKLKNRRTINPCLAWNSRKNHNKYSLAWEDDAYPRYSSNTILLDEIYWASHYPDARNESCCNYEGLERFLIERNWKHAAEYGKTLALRIVDPDFPHFIAKVAKIQVAKSVSDGVMLDWWINRQPSGYSKNQVAKARKDVARAIREELGSEAIILGNVSWSKDKDTVRFINGVFLELPKEPFYSSSNRLYNSTELSKIQDSLEFYDYNLQAPRLICLGGWRKTKSLSDEDRNTPENRKMAKLLTAMSVVIPENGYILYGDNNPDTPDEDHDHLYYDFYNFDIGKPTSEYIKVSSGVGYKEHEQGFIAYNINSNKKKITRDNGQSFEIAGKSGLFCKDVGNDTECLPID